jgi:hypothetical protein
VSGPHPKLILSHSSFPTTTRAPPLATTRAPSGRVAHAPLPHGPRRSAPTAAPRHWVAACEELPWQWRPPPSRKFSYAGELPRRPARSEELLREHQVVSRAPLRLGESRASEPPQRRSGGRAASSSSHGVDPTAERPDRGSATADRADTGELLTSALESGTDELLTSPRQPWRPVLPSSARACSHVWLWRQLTMPESHRPWRPCARVCRSWRPCAWSSPSSLRPGASTAGGTGRRTQGWARREAPHLCFGIFFMLQLLYIGVVTVFLTCCNRSSSGCNRSSFMFVNRCTHVAPVFLTCCKCPMRMFQN